MSCAIRNSSCIFPCFLSVLVRAEEGEWAGLGRGGVLKEPKESAAYLRKTLFLFFSRESGRESASSSSIARRVITWPLETEVAATLCARCVVGESEHTWTERGLDLCLYVFP